MNENVVNEFIDFKREQLLKVCEEFGYEATKNIQENYTNKIRKKLYDVFENGIDVSNGLVEEILKPFDFIKKGNDFFLKFKLKSKIKILNINNVKFI